jgi:hypothetical protein
MYILVKKIDGEDVIIGSSQGKVSVKDEHMIVYDIPNDEYSPEMINCKIDGFDEV